jgi:hypothetical protein
MDNKNEKRLERLKSDVVLKEIIGKYYVIRTFNFISYENETVTLDFIVNSFVFKIRIEFTTNEKEKAGFTSRAIHEIYLITFVNIKDKMEMATKVPMQFSVIFEQKVFFQFFVKSYGDTKMMTIQFLGMLS